MKTQYLLSMMIAAALVMVAPQPAHAWSRPALFIAAGTTFGPSDTSTTTFGDPAGGGASIAVTPMWPIADHARFGVSLFADDLGSHVATLYNPADHSGIGTAAFGHRWAWGGAWRADVDVAHRGNWAASATGTWGWSRIEDDVRGVPKAAASAVGVGIGAGIRGPIAPAQTLGLVVRWNRLFARRNASYRRVEHYATVALEWGWAAAPRP